MRYLLVLAAAAFLAVGCAGNKEDETGAAPDRGDATVTATDTASFQTDTTTAAMPSDSSAEMTDTTAASDEATGWSNRREMGVDSVDAQGEVQTTDSTSWTEDSYSAPADSAAPADTTAQQ